MRRFPVPSGSARGRGRPLPRPNNGSLGEQLGGNATTSTRNAWTKNPSGTGPNKTDAKPSAVSKFEEACAKIQESSQKFLTTDQFSDDEDEEEDLPNNSAILDKVVCTYTDESGDDSELGRTRQFLLDAIKSGANVCLICIATIKKNEAIWSCSGCYCLFHLLCIQAWAKDSMLQQTLSSATEEQHQKWCCPKCRNDYPRSECPTKYFCFCKKVVNPEFDPWQVPHSCGQTCGRPLKPFCGHKCNLLCHPGPCPSCPQTVQVACHCKRQKPQTRRCSHRQWSCGSLCKKLLSCGQHPCTEPCHPGDCPTCPRQSVQACICGRNRANRPCADSVWQCIQVCDQPLACGHHRCEKICHTGSCGTCPRSEKRACPCGKTNFTLPCTEDVPTCGDTCGKLLTCDIHKCAQRCHTGNCGLCLQMNVKKCRCGQKEKSLPCHKEYLCEVKCKRVRDCGRHPCNRKCCDGNCSACEQQCGRTLGCRNHKCNSRCHSGPCYPCPLHTEVKCFCGGTVIKVPCGRERVTRPPRCTKDCRIPPDCHHQAQKRHRCHFGDCPTCQQVCAKQLQCGHKCPATCHSAVPTQIQSTQKRSGPWEPPITPRIEVICKQCPPCLVPMPVTCIGNHETQDFPCFMARPNSCHRQCGRSLPCGNHCCSLICHKVTNASSETVAGDNCATCEEPCCLPRSSGCTHQCLLPCHPAPCPPCKQMVRQRCHCQLNTRYVECHSWTATTVVGQAALLSCGDRCPKEMNCGHRCLSICHDGACTTSDQCHKKVAIRCACKRIKKEFHCYLVQQQLARVTCDAVCHEKHEMDKKTKEIEDMKRKQEAAQKAMDELEKYQRKLEGKKRKPRKQRQVMEDDSLWSTHKWTILVVSICFVLIGIAYALMATTYHSTST